MVDALVVPCLRGDLEVGEGWREVVYRLIELEARHLQGQQGGWEVVDWLVE